MSSKITYKTLREQIVQMIRNKILTGEILPGERIVESDLSEELQVSRVPIREALRQIEQEGLIIYTPNKGCTVKIFTPEDAWEVFFLRNTFENISLKKVNGILPDENLEKMENAVLKMKNLIVLEKNNISLDHSSENFFDLDEIFHSQIAMAGKMNKVYEFWGKLNGLNMALLLTETRVVLNMEQQYIRHRNLLDKLKVGSYKISTQAINEHYFETEKRLFENLKGEN